MGKKIDASVANVKLAKIGTGTHLTFCSAEPANYAGIAPVKLIAATIAAASNGGADGTSGAYTFSTNGSNRQVSIAAQTGMTATAGAPTNCVYACIDDGATLLVGTTVTAFSVTSGGSYNSNAITFNDSLIPT